MANQNTIITIGFDYNLTKAYGDLEKARQKLEAKVKPLNLDLGGKNITNMNKSLKETNSILGEIGGSLGHNLSKMAEWAISGTLLYGSLRKLREISEIVYDVDDAMRQVRGVTGMTANDTDMLVTKYQKLADELNSTVSAMSEMSLEMYRQGLTAEETASRMATITKLAGIENLDVGAVTEYVTAGVNSFERLGLSAEEYGDKVAKAAAVSATSVDEIAKGLQRSSNIASVTGLSFSELISYISTVSSVSRLSASTIGNSMKGVLSRFSKITEMGEDNTIVYGEVRDAVKSVGIAFEDTNGRMRPVSDIFKEIAAGWKDMDKNNKHILLIQLAEPIM